MGWGGMEQQGRAYLPKGALGWLATERRGVALATSRLSIRASVKSWTSEAWLGTLGREAPGGPDTPSTALDPRCPPTGQEPWISSACFSSTSSPALSQ